MAQTVEILGDVIGSDNFGVFRVEIGPFDCSVSEVPGKFDGDHTGLWEAQILGVFLSEKHISDQLAADALTKQLKVIATAIAGFAGGEVKWNS